MALPSLYAFTNTHILSGGKSLPQDIYFSPDTGTITPNYARSRPDIAVTRIDLQGKHVVAPGFLELQINGLVGVHFTTLGTGDGASDETKLKKVARELVRRGVTSWWATVPTVAQERWKEILPQLSPRSFDNAATLLGAHVEGPYLQPSKNGAHNPTFFRTPTSVPATNLYGDYNLRSIVKYITLAPELPGSVELIQHLQKDYPDVVVSLGHSSATYAQGLEGLKAGGKSLTHLFNAMSPLHHRDPGLVGLISNNTPSSSDDKLAAAPEHQLLSSSMSVDAWLARQLGTQTKLNQSDKPECYYSIIPDTIHLHPAVLAMAHRTSPDHCILITDAIELAGLPDGTYPPNDQITHAQVKLGNRNTIQGTETLIGSCIMLDECVRNMMKYAGCSLAEAVRCVTENIASLMGRSAERRGRLDVGCYADFAILDRGGNVKQTWIGGLKVWDSQSGDEEGNSIGFQ